MLSSKAAHGHYSYVLVRQGCSLCSTVGKSYWLGSLSGWGHNLGCGTFQGSMIRLPGQVGPEVVFSHWMGLLTSFPVWADYKIVSVYRDHWLGTQTQPIELFCQSVHGLGSANVGRDTGQDVWSGAAPSRTTAHHDPCLRCYELLFPLCPGTWRSNPNYFPSDPCELRLRWAFLEALVTLRKLNAPLGLFFSLEKPEVLGICFGAMLCWLWEGVIGSKGNCFFYSSNAFVFFFCEPKG